MPVTIGRRELIAALGGAAVAWPMAARAQQSERVRRIGVLTALDASDPQVKAWLAAFEEGLQKLGWSQHRNLGIEYRWPGNDEGRLQTHAAELVRWHPTRFLPPRFRGARVVMKSWTE